MIRLDVRLYDGSRIEFPLPDGSSWEDARRALSGLHSRFSGVVARAEIMDSTPTSPALERLDRTLVGAL